MDVGLMVEGQNGLTWERWSHILALAERLGFPSVFRSDHFFGRTQQDSLEAYLSLVVAAVETSCIRFGPLVTPVTVRTPVNVGRMAAQIDVLSQGRFVLGLGAGGLETEHQAYGIPFPPVGERFDRLEETINLMRALWVPGRTSYNGRYYRIEDVECLPKPAPGRPPITIGGTGERRTLRLVAQYADEWNCDGYLAPHDYARKVAVLERHCESVGRDPKSIRRSMLAHWVVGPTGDAVDRAIRGAVYVMWADPSASLEQLRQVAEARGMVVGGTTEVIERLGQLAELGLQEVQLEHYNFDSDEVPEYLASEIAPALAGL